MELWIRTSNAEDQHKLGSAKIPGGRAIASNHMQVTNACDLIDHVQVTNVYDLLLFTCK